MSTSDLHPTRLSTLDRIQEIVRDLVGDDSISLAPDTKPGDVDGWDSLANVSIIFSIEEEFGVQLGEQVMSGVATVGDLVGLVELARRDAA